MTSNQLPTTNYPATDYTAMTVLPWWLTPAGITLTFAICLLLELSRPLRRDVSSKLRRTVRNFTVGGISLAVLTLLQIPILLPVAAWTARNGLGLMNLFAVPPPVSLAVQIVLLDYTLWIWHWASHVVPFLWRFHLVHHVDRDLDASTALRFHFGELSLSVLFRALQIVVIGATPLSVALWQFILFICILFHHSNIRLPIALERFLVRIIVTPRMHGIHHSAVHDETDSNWSSILSAWDFLHRTAVLHVPQGEILIGVPAYQEEATVTAAKLLLMPFVKQKDDWTGQIERPHEGSPTVLAE